MKPTLTLAHSADADDVFMWWPITGKVDPKAPHAVLAPPVIDTGRFGYRSLPADIQELNVRATTAADLDITAISIFNFTLCHKAYALTACGWSFGDGFGPKLVVRTDSPLGPPPWGASSSVRRIAVPGLQTTAFLTLSLMLGAGTFEPVPMPFDAIVGAVRNGADAQGKPLHAGLLIHESQLDHHKHGLKTIADVGAWWKQMSGLPLPLGGNAVKRSLEVTYGAGTLRHIAGVLTRSIAYALEHRAESLAYSRTFSPALSDADLDRYITMYVSPLTLNPGTLGKQAVELLFSRGSAAKLCVNPGELDLIEPD